MAHPKDQIKPSGLYHELPAPPQIVDVVVESGAMRSRSEGYIPCVVMRFQDDKGDTYEGMMRCDDDAVFKIAADMIACVEAARNDVKASQPGRGKSHGTR